MCWWISYFGIIALIAFACAQALFISAFIIFLRKVSPSSLTPVYLAALWVAFEWVQTHIPFVSFSWLTFSTFAVDTPALRFARIGGGALVSFLLVLAAMYMLRLIHKVRTHTFSMSRKAGAVGCLLVALIGMMYSFSFIELGKTKTHVSVASIQGNDKNRYLTVEEYDNNFLQESHIALAAQLEKKYDYLIFPESAFRTDPQDDENLMDDLLSISNSAKRMVILNTVTYENGKEFNRNYFYSPQMMLLDFYDKQRLVPFGEYVPGNSIIGNLAIFDDIGSGFSPGSKNTTVEGVATLICYESTFSDDVKKALTDDPKLLVITTNNRSYRRSGNSSQHLALTQLRAAEYGISVVQSSISGHSALINNFGEVLDSTPLFNKAILTGELTYGLPDTVYSRTGDWLSLMCLFVVGYLCVRHRRNFAWKNQMLKK